MAADYAQRRRLAFAVAITAIAAPAALLLDRGDDQPAQPATTVIGSVVAGTTVPSIVATPEGDTATGTDAMGTAPAAFLEPSGTIAPDEPATIAIPRLPHAVEGRATFTRSISNVTSCQVKATVGAPYGGAITVTNLDNSRSVQCIWDVAGADPDHEVVLNADAFSQIADITDAPVHVQLTW